MKNITISMEMSQHGLSKITSATDYIFLNANFYLLYLNAHGALEGKMYSLAALILSGL